MSETKNNAGIITADELEKFFNDEPITAKEPETDNIEVDDFFETAVTTPKAEELQEPVITPSAEPQTNFYKEIVAQFLEEGDWEDVEIELEEGQEPVALSSLQEITPELFKELKAAQKQLKEEEFNSKYISVEGLDDTTKKIIELKKAGGDITPLLEIEKQHVHPLQGLDLDSEEVHEMLVRSRLSHRGIHPKTIDAEIQRLKTELILDVEAKSVVDEINTRFNATVEEELNKQKQFNEKLQEEQKQFKTSITKQYRDFGLKDTLVKSLVDNSAKYDENGLTEADKLYFAAKENPELFAEVNFLLTNRDAYNEFKSTKIKNKVTTDTVRKIFKLSTKSSSSSAAPAPEKPIDKFFQT